VILACGPLRLPRPTMRLWEPDYKYWRALEESSALSCSRGLWVDSSNLSLYEKCCTIESSTRGEYICTLLFLPFGILIAVAYSCSVMAGISYVCFQPVDDKSVRRLVRLPTGDRWGDLPAPIFDGANVLSFDGISLAILRRLPYLTWDLTIGCWRRMIESR